MAVDARELLRNLLTNYGFNNGQISDIVSSYTQYVQTQNITAADYVNAIMPTTKAYAQRFAGNELRKQANLSPLSPAEYMQQEDSIKSLFKSYGLPNNFYDTNEDIARFIGNDVSVQELQSRVEAASSFLNSSSTSANTLTAIKNIYGLTQGDMLAYVLDPTLGTEAINKKSRAVDLASKALNNSLTLSRSFAEQLAGNTTDDALLTSQQADQVFTNAATTKAETDRLKALEGTAGFTTEQLVNNTLGRDANTNSEITRLRQRENARFGGRAASNTAATGTNSGGAV